MAFGDVVSTYRTIGVRGVVKSVRHSLRHTSSVDKLVLGPRVIVEVSPSALIEVSSHFRFASLHKGASHVNLGRSKFSLDNSAVLRAPSKDGSASIGPCSVLHVEGEFSMGDSYINSHARIICEEEISIGDGCAIAWNVELLDTDRHQLILDDEPQQTTAPIQIGNDVWIGHDVSIKKGVHVGDGAVIASNSIVTNDVPEQALVAGSPAEVIHENVDWT